MVEATQPLSIAIDGGGGTLRWAVFAGEALLSAGELPGAQMQLLGPERFRERLAEAIGVALETVQADRQKLEQLGMGLSGVDRSEEVHALYAWVRTQYPAVRQAWVGNDGFAPLRDGVGALNGLLLIAGTGTICLGCAQGRGGELRRVRVGGWGGLMDDAGSAFWFGRQVLKFACRVADGRAAHKTLLARVLPHLGLAQPLDLIPRIAQREPALQRAEVAGLSRLVSELAVDNDPFALELMQRGVAELALLVTTAARQLRATPDVQPVQPLPLVLQGGVVRQWSEFRELLLERLRLHEELEVRTEPPDALRGALALAREQAFTVL